MYLQYLKKIPQAQGPPLNFHCEIKIPTWFHFSWAAALTGRHERPQKFCRGANSKKGPPPPT